jgi:integrase/recombinase XerC
MVVERLPTDELYAQLHIPLDSLLSSKPLYKEALHYLVACKVENKSKKTLGAYAYVLNYFLDFNLSPKPTKNDIRAFLLAMQERITAKGKPASIYTQHMFHRTLKTFFTWLVNENIWEHSPMEGMKAPKLPKLVITPLNKDDMRGLLVVTSGQRFVDLRNRALIWMYYDTGVRLAEMAGMQLTDIDMNNETVKVRGKGDKERIVRMGKVTQKALLTYLMVREDHYKELWVTEERKPLSLRGLQIAIKRLCSYAEVKSSKQGPHIFRHTAAITYLRNGGDVFTLQTMLGHSTLEMTRKYVSSLGTDDMIKAHKKASPADNLKF